MMMIRRLFRCFMSFIYSRKADLSAPCVEVRRRFIGHGFASPAALARKRADLPFPCELPRLLLHQRITIAEKRCFTSL